MWNCARMLYEYGNNERQTNSVTETQAANNNIVMHNVMHTNKHEFKQTNI